MSEDIFVGIDVSKNHLDYTWLPDGGIHRCDNTPDGIRTLLMKAIGEKKVALVTMEATGGYQNLVCTTLMEAGRPVAVVNPRQVRDFAKACGRMAKTDRLDVAIIARYGQTMQPRPQAPKEPARVRLENLLRRRDQLNWWRR